MQLLMIWLFFCCRGDIIACVQCGTKTYRVIHRPLLGAMCSGVGRKLMDTQCKQKKSELGTETVSVCRRQRSSNTHRLNFPQRRRRAYPPSVSEPTSRTSVQSYWLHSILCLCSHQQVSVIFCSACDIIQRCVVSQYLFVYFTGEGRAL